MTLTAVALRELLDNLRERGGDATEVEVKRGAGGCPNVADTICAFANMPGGGTLILGIDENNDFAMTGVDDPAALQAGLATQARTSLSVPVQITFEEAQVDGAILVIAFIAPVPVSQRPCLYQGKAYLRQADGDYVMSEQEVQQLLAIRDRPRHDIAPVGSTSIDDLDPDLLRNFIAAARSSSPRLSGLEELEILRRKGVLAPQGPNLTLAGLYALGSYPQQFAPNLSITAAVILDPRSGKRTSDLTHLDGPLPALLEGAVDWVIRNTHTTIRFGADGHGRDVNEIPLVAVRELIANALVHRDLGAHTQSKRVEIRLLNDLLVIANPGGLWGVSRRQLGTPEGKSAVNEFLYDICKLVRTPSGSRLIEGEGGGIREVLRSLREANLRPPRFIDKGVSFTAIVPRHFLLSPEDLEWLAEHDPQHRLSTIQQQIAASMRHGQEWTNSMVRAEFSPIDSTVARAALQGLVNLGFAEASGERGQTTYRLATNLREDHSSTTEPTIVIRTPSFDADANQPELALGSSESETDSPLEEVTKHGPALWQAMSSGPQSLDQLVDTTGLSRRQINYALARLNEQGWLTVQGGWGVRGTTYARKSTQSGTPPTSATLN